MGDHRDLDLGDVIVCEYASNEGGGTDDFEVIGIVEDDVGLEFAVSYSEKPDLFLVTDIRGNFINDEAEAQEILDEFFELAIDNTSFVGQEP